MLYLGFLYLKWMLSCFHALQKFRYAFGAGYVSLFYDRFTSTSQTNIFFYWMQGSTKHVICKPNWFQCKGSGVKSDSSDTITYNVNLQPERHVVCCYAPFAPGSPHSWLVEPNHFTNFVPLGIWLSCMTSYLPLPQPQIRDLNGVLLCYSADFRLENNFRAERGGGRGRCQDGLAPMVDDLGFQSTFGTAWFPRKPSSIVQWHRSFPGSRPSETAEGAKPSWIKVLLNIRKTWVWSLQLHFITFIHINRPNPKRIQTWTFHLQSLCDENVSHFVSQTRNSLRDLYYISS